MRALFPMVALLVLGCQPKTMSHEDPSNDRVPDHAPEGAGASVEYLRDLRLIGEPVTISYVADPAIGHGQFRLEHHGSNAVTAAVKSVWLELGGEQHPLDDIKVFVREQARMVDPEGFEVEANASLTLLVGFPEIRREPPFGESDAVGFRLSVNGDELQALSLLEFVRRIPR